MSRKYVQLTIEERAAIKIQRGFGCMLRAIARSLRRDPSTISRELKRNQVSGHYHPAFGHQSTVKRKRKPVQKLLASPPRWELVQQLIKANWSPQQISGRLKTRFPDQAGNRLSHETIYRTIYALQRRGLRQEMIKALRQQH